MIVTEKISKKFGANFAIKDISLTFNAKEIITVIGSSGSGKSTLLRCLNGLEVPTSGRLFINNEKLTAKNRRKLCLKLGMVFQNFNLFPHLTVRENLIYSPQKVLGMQASLANAKAEELLKTVGLSQKIDERPNNLSGGQKQRVAICRALMMEPEIMLFDEPTSALDPEVIKDVVEVINSLKTQMGMIIVTHHLRFAKAVADRVIYMDHGLVLADQPAKEFFHKPKSHRARLFLENIGDLM